MITKVLKSKLFYLLVIIILCSSSIISFCLISTKKINKGKEYYVEIKPNSSNTSYGQYFKVEKTNLYSYEYFDAYIEENSNIIKTYVVEESNVTIFSEVNKDQLLGKISDSNVLAEFDGYILDIRENGSTKEIDVYYYDQFEIKIEITEGQYSRKEIDYDKQYFLDCEGQRNEIIFLGFDVSNYKNSKVIYATFIPKDCHMILSSKADVSVVNINKSYINAFVLDSSLFDDKISGKYFMYIKDEKEKYVSIYCSDIIDGKAIIESLSNDYSLHEGDILYAI